MKDQITITQMPDSHDDGYTRQNFKIVVRRFGIRKVAVEHVLSHAQRLAYDFWTVIGRGDYDEQ